MSKKISVDLETAQRVVLKGVRDGVAHLIAKDMSLDGRTVNVRGKSVVNFGSCSYLGLELDKRLQMGAIDAISRYGTQFSSSRSFLAIHLYEKLEDLLGKIFGRPTLAAPTTSLGHLAMLPVLVNKNDALIIDHLAHASIQNAVQLVKANGARVEVIRHNSMERLEKRIQKLKKTYSKIWYMADGVYSMYGDCAPLKELERLLQEHEQFHLYLDDAHGMGWTGRNGSGYGLSQIDLHSRMVLITSLNKSFAAGGAALVLPNEELYWQVRLSGSTLMFSGPLQPAQLGAAIASAEIHLSEEISQLQIRHQKKVKFFMETAKQYCLPIADNSCTPIFFVGVGTPDVGSNLCQKLINLGHFTSIAAYPSVPYFNTGLRVSLTLHQTDDDIKKLLE